MGATVSGGITQTGGVTFQAPPSANLIFIYQVTSNSNTVRLNLGGTPNAVVDWGDDSTNSYTTSGAISHSYSVTGNYKVSISGNLSAFNMTGISLTNANLIEVRNWGRTGLTNLFEAFQSLRGIQSVPNNFPTTVTNVANMFNNTFFADSAGNLAFWDVSNVANMSYMFRSTDINSNLANWNVSKVTDMANMFVGVDTFNQPIGNWNVSNVTTMSNMFDGATIFNQSLANWNVSNATNMSSMFRDANNFNQPIGNWNVANVANMTNMFNTASSFNQDLTNWCVPSFGGPPSGFSTSTTSWIKENRQPLWGTCPQPGTPEAITYIGSAVGGNSVSIPASQVGDVILAFAYNDAGTVPSVTGIWSNIDSGGSISNQLRVVYQISNGSPISGTWTNTDNLVVSVYRNVNANVTTSPLPDVGGSQGSLQLSTSNSNNISYANNAYYFNQSWVMAFAAFDELNSNLANVPGDLTLRVTGQNTSANTTVALFDSNGMYDKWSSNTISIGGTARNYITFVARLAAKLS